MNFIDSVFKFFPVRFFQVGELNCRRNFKPVICTSIIILTIRLCSCSNRVTFLLKTPFIGEKIEYNINDKSFCFGYKTENHILICPGNHIIVNNCIMCTKFDNDVSHILLKKYIITYPDDFPLISKFIEQSIEEKDGDDVVITLEYYYFDDFLYILNILKNPDNIIGSIEVMNIAFILKFLMKFEIKYSKYLNSFLKSLSVYLFLHYMSSDKPSRTDFSIIINGERNTGSIVIFIQKFLNLFYVNFERLNYFFSKKNSYFPDLKKGTMENFFSEKSRIMISPLNIAIFKYFLESKILYNFLNLLFNAIKVRKLTFNCLTTKLNWNQTKFAKLIPFSCIEIEISMYYLDISFIKYIYPLLSRFTTKKFKISVTEICLKTFEIIKILHNLQILCISYDSNTQSDRILKNIFQLPSYMPTTHISLTLSDSVLKDLYSFPSLLDNIKLRTFSFHLKSLKSISYLIDEVYRKFNLNFFFQTLAVRSKSRLKSSEYNTLKKFKFTKSFSCFFDTNTIRNYINQEFGFLSSFVYIKRIRISNIIIKDELLRFIFHSKSLKSVQFDKGTISEAMNSCYHFENDNLCLENFFIGYLDRPSTKNLLKYLQNFRKMKSIKISGYDHINSIIIFNVIFYDINDKILEFFDPEFIFEDYLYIKNLSMNKIMFNSDLINGIFSKKWNLSKLRKLNLEEMSLSKPDMIFLSSLVSLLDISFQRVKFLDCFFGDLLSHLILKKNCRLHLSEISLSKSDLIKFSHLKNLKYFELCFCSISNENLFLLRHLYLKNLNEFKLHVTGLTRCCRFFYKEFFAASILEILYNR
ncbi:hypothetical protein CWI37_0455p0020 [Hamiltosporidium tvaerminnensis]|uniref:Uncharacterized protein n=1 Tax=Hamiltosporidium tvaerminnensis TaxID=1176355 RepID=A0A4Q9L4U4_9MICR|nr:hypothetical protein CWI37_0455p0020 [Hamiltosporidium tvaerminnensis]